MQQRRSENYAVIPPAPSRDFWDFFTAKKLGIAASVVIVAAVLGVAFAEQAPDMASTTTLTPARSGIVVGHS